MPLRLAVACLALAASPVRAQTIADYGRAQRALLEATMVQAAARAAALAASSPSPSSAGAAPGGLPVVAGSPAVPAGATAARPAAVPRAEPVVEVSGVFASPRVAWAEILVDGRAWRLARGEDVPGTPWRVAAVSAEEVRLDLVGGDRSRRSAAAPRQRRFVLGSGR